MRYTALGKEQTYGVAVTASRYAEAISAIKPDLGWIIPPPIASRAYRKKVKGNYRARGTIGEFMVEPENLIGELMLGVMGQGSVTNPYAGVYTHTFKPADTLPSYTARLGVEQVERILSGLLVESLTLRFQQGKAVSATAEVLSGFEETNGEINSNPTFSPLEAFTLQPDLTAFTIGGTESKTLLYDAEITIKNNIPFNNGDLSGRSFGVKRYGQREITGKLSLYFDNTTEMNRFLAGTEFSFAGSVSSSVIASTHRYGIGFDLRKCVYLKDAVPDVTEITDGLKIVNAPFQAFYDTTGGFNAEASLTLQNTVTSY